jgi:hypothetical protein
MAPTLSLKCKEWFIEYSDKDRIEGPYETAAVALQVGLAAVAEARRQGQFFTLSVRDNHGIARECKLIDKPERDTCFQCESLWTNERSSVTPRCPLRAALSVYKD